MLVFLSFIVCGILFNQVNGYLRLSGILTDHMVLQIPIESENVPPTKLFGTAFLNETVYITGSSGFPGPYKLTPKCTNGESYCNYGNWSVPIIPNTDDSSFPGPFSINFYTTMPHKPDNTSNSTIIVTSNVTLTDVYFGQVFVCSGQSNMEYSMADCKNYRNEQNYSNLLPNIRMFQVFHTFNNYTQQNLTSNALGGEKGWVPAASNTIGAFSCVCWESARILAQWIQTTYNTKPYIGLIEADIGGTSVFFWGAGIAGQACNLTGNLPHSGECAVNEAPYFHRPGSIYNAMVNPLCMNGNGISIREAIYYQGEADSGENDYYNANAYICNLNGLIYTWRYCFNQSTLPFIIVQLPNGMVSPYVDDDVCTVDVGYNGYYTGWPGIQLAQYEVYKINDQCGLVTSQDNGQDTLHYPYKLEVSNRVALWSRYFLYNENNTLTKNHALYGIDPLLLENTDVNPKPPQFVRAYKINPSDLTVYIEIENAGTTNGDGLTLKDSVNCSAFSNSYGTATVCLDECTVYNCCELGGVDTLKFRMEGWFWYTKNGGTNEYVGLLGWMPGNVTEFLIDNKTGNGIIVAQPVLPYIGGQNWPASGDSLVRYETIAVRQVEMGSSSACTIVNQWGIPLSKSGPHSIELKD